MRVCLVSLLLLLAVAGLVAAQDPDPTPIAGSQVIRMDLVKGKLENDALAPFDVRPAFMATLPDTIDSSLKIKAINELHLFMLPYVCPGNLNGYTKGTVSQPGNHTTVAFTHVSDWYQPAKTLFGQNRTIRFLWLFGPDSYLKPNRDYCLLVRRSMDENTPDPFQQTVSVHTASKFSDYVKLDFGVGVAPQPGVNVLFGSIAVHGYAIPINNNTDLAEGFGLGKQLLLRTSLFVGIAPITFSSGTKQEIKPLTGVGNLVVGVGFRGPGYWPGKNKAADRRVRGKFILQAMRLNAGWLIYSQSAANPVDPGKRTKYTPYVSLTYDLSLTSLLGPIAKLFGG